MADDLNTTGTPGGTDTATPPPPAPAPAAAPAAAAAPPPEAQSDTGADGTRIPLEQMKAESWGTRVYHGVLSALGGSSDVALARDPATGKMVATAVKSGPGQQWKRIISGALTGAAAAQGAGPGPGGPMRGFGLGVQAVTDQRQQQQRQQRHDADEDYNAQQKAVTSQAQNALLNHQIAASTFNLKRAQVEASQADADRETNFVKTIAEGGEGSQDMGVFPDFQSVLKAFKEMPQLHEHQAGGRLVSTLHVDGNGKIDGVHAALVTPDWLSSKIGKDLPIAVKQIVDGKLTESTFTIPAGSLTGDQYAKLVMGQSKDALDEYEKAQKLKNETTTANAGAAKDKAEAAKAWGEADEAKAIAGTGGAGGTLVDEIGRGQMPVGRLSYLLARKPELMAAVAQKYPGFDASKVDGYAATVKEFTSGKASVALNSGATALRHMLELKQLNTPMSHVPHTAAWTAYQNKVDTLATELAKFYGDTTIPAIQGIKDTLASTLPGNRAKAIATQASSMGDKFDEYENTWKNAAPSAAYEAPMPHMSAGAMAARAQLDPRYAERQVEELQQNGAGGPRATQPAAVKVQPGEATAIAADGSTLVVRGGKWVTAQP